MHFHPHGWAAGPCELKTLRQIKCCSETNRGFENPNGTVAPHPQLLVNKPNTFLDNNYILQYNYCD